jgi:dethiobiotin synthetase
MQSIFISGTGIGIGKTVIAAILTEALQADYWKPIQAGIESETDAGVVGRLISNSKSKIHTEGYRFNLPASPHLGARNEGVTIDIKKLERSSRHLSSVNEYLIIEGAGGIMVPLNENDFVADFITQLKTKVILVSRNYLGSINHSLLTAQYCQHKKLDVLGWIFNDHFMDYEQEVEKWSGIKKIASIPFTDNLTKEFIKEQAQIILPELKKML